MSELIFYNPNKKTISFFTEGQYTILYSQHNEIEEVTLSYSIVGNQEYTSWIDANWLKVVMTPNKINHLYYFDESCIDSKPLFESEFPNRLGFIPCKELPNGSFNAITNQLEWEKWFENQLIHLNN